MTQQNNQRRVLGMLALAVLAGCARQLAPIDVRTVSKVNDVRDVKQADAYSRAVVWFDNNHERAGIRTTSRDAATGTIVGTGEMQCHSDVGSGLRAMGMGLNQNYLRFNIQFQARDGRFKVTFTELFYYVTDVRYAGSNLAQGPSNQAEVDTLYRDCLKPLEVSLVKAIAGPPDSSF